MIRQIDLEEYEKSEPHSLSVSERDTLREIVSSLTIEPVAGKEGEYYLTPGFTVGAVEIGDLSVFIQPKIGISQLLSLACYAMGVFEPKELRQFDFEDQKTLPDTLALALAAAARRAFTRGLLHGYRIEAEALYSVRGRIRLDDQIRHRFGIPMPIEVRYDEFTDDILANQLVKAAAYRVGRMRLRSQSARSGLGWIAGILDNVSPVEFPRNSVPEIHFDQLNEHYKGVVSLSQLILRHSEFEAVRGKIRASGFLMNMNSFFQKFVTQALREALGISAHVFGQKSVCSLDEENRVGLRPDLSWWNGSSYLFVGDAKYKKVANESIPNADLYQMLAYTTALDLPVGLLIYAAGEADGAAYQVRHSGKRLEIAVLDLSGTLDKVLARIERMAKKVVALRDEVSC